MTTKVIKTADESTSLLKKSAVEKAMIVLMNSDSPYSKQDKEQWLYLSMFFFHGMVIDPNDINEDNITIDETSEMMAYRYQNKNYILPVLGYAFNSKAQ